MAGNSKCDGEEDGSRNSGCYSRKKTSYVPGNSRGGQGGSLVLCQKTGQSGRVRVGVEITDANGKEGKLQM